MNEIPLTSIRRIEEFGAYGAFALDISINDAPSELTDEQYKAVYAAEKLIREAFMVQRIRDNPAVMQKAADEKRLLLACFPTPIYVEEIPNGYDTSWTSRHLPWFRVTTTKGVITIGWRRQVICISWTPSVNMQEAETLFPHERVTRDDRSIHAWSYEKAKEYISVLLT